MRRVKIFYRAAALVIMAGFAAVTVPATSFAEDFFAGKQIRLICGSQPPGIYDTSARLLAKYLAKYIPGHPTIIVENMPGAGSLKAADYVANIAPRDGTVFGGAIGGLPAIALLTPDVAKFDLNKLSWIGSMGRDPYVGYVWNTSKIKTLEDAKKIPSTMGGTSAGAAGVDMVIVADALFDFKFKVVAGYQTSADVKIAMERGELDGTFANAWSDLTTLNPDWVRDGKVRIIVQHGMTKDPTIPGDPPLFMDQAKTEAERQALYFMLSRQEASTPFFGPPGVPQERLEILRHAFDAAVKDAEYRQDAIAAHVSVQGPMNGEQLAALVAKMTATPSSIVDRMRMILANYNEAR